MRSALHPFNGRIINTDSYIKEFGNNKPNFEERPICPVCNQRMSIIAASSPNSTTHFSHMPKSGFCPTKMKSSSPYIGLHPRNPNREKAITIMGKFRENWKKHYFKLNSMVKCLNMNEFINLLKISIDERIWFYADIEEYQIPYIFSTLKDFPPYESYKIKNEYARKCYFRFWFDSSIRRYDDLWIHRQEPPKLWSAWYKLQEGKRKPLLEDILGFNIVNMSSDFLNKDVIMHNFIVKNVVSWMDCHFRI